MIVKILKDGKWQERLYLVKCEYCSKEREVKYAVAKDKTNPKHRCQSCATIASQTGRKRSKESKKKMSDAQRKNNNGGVRHNQCGGYKQVIVDEYHPRKKDRKGGNYILEHILIVEKNIGRFIEQHELVHHIDKNKQNNNIENLHLFSGKDHKESRQMHNAAHESLENIAIILYKLGLVEFKDGKYNIKEKFKDELASLAASIL
jgi:hypothetical protein